MVPLLTNPSIFTRFETASTALYNVTLRASDLLWPKSDFLKIPEVNWAEMNYGYTPMYADNLTQPTVLMWSGQPVNILPDAICPGLSLAENSGVTAFSSNTTLANRTAASVTALKEPLPSSNQILNPIFEVTEDTTKEYFKLAFTIWMVSNYLPPTLPIYVPLFLHVGRVN